MKRIKQQKKGISLIVLVITIIVMIILAAAIILSLDGSDIIERAKGAQSSNDVATAKEIVALAKSEWSFEKKEGYDTFREYAESKLEEAGFDMDKTYVEESGRVLFDTAARFAKAGVQIGTEVTGYTLNSTTSYTTSGKENTYDSATGTSATITRDSNITWKYMGIDEHGNALIVGSVTTTTPKVKLGGKGGYLNGPEELNNACVAMYSGAMGIARSINIDDVTRVLEYTGETGSYYDCDAAETIPIAKVKTIDEIAKAIGYDMSNFESETPETGKYIGSYNSDIYSIYKLEDAGEYNTAMQNLIYPGTANPTLTLEYWLASACVNAHFSVIYGFDSYAHFAVRLVRSSNVAGQVMFASYGGSVSGELSVRPVVSLSSDIQVTYNGTTAAIN